MTTPSRKWLWLDLETTGVGYDLTNPQTYTDDAILEVAAIITDADLNEVSAFGPFPIRTTSADLALMDDFVRNMHTQTGLLDRVASSAAQRLSTVDEALANWMADHGLERKAILAGSSVKMDFEFLRRHAPLTFARLGYRVIDVSSFKEALRDWMPQVVEQVEADKVPSHKAMEDIRWSIHELRIYRKALGLGGKEAAA